LRNGANGALRARVTQIINLLALAPDIQEEISFLPRTTRGGDDVTERGLPNVIGEPLFAKQRQLLGRRESALRA